MLARSLTQSDSTGPSSYCNSENVANSKAPTPRMGPKKFKNSNSALGIATTGEKIRKRASTESKFGCDKCSFKAQYASQVRSHSRYHSSEKPFKCPNLGCDYKTRWAYAVRRHQQWCRGQILIPNAETSDELRIVGKNRRKGTRECSMDRRESMTGEKIVRRASTATESKFRCDKCSFKASCASVLLKHSRYHSSEKPFKCPNLGCDYKTRWAYAVTRHQQWCRGQIQIPTAQTSDELPIVPDVNKRRSEGTTECSKESAVITDGERLNSCTICGFTPKHKWNLKRHLLVHKDRAFHCPIPSCKQRSCNLMELCRRLDHIELPPKKPLQSEDNLGPHIECEADIDVDGNSSSLDFACMLCEFVGSTELSALKHSRQHKTVVIILNRL